MNETAEHRATEQPPTGASVQKHMDNARRYVARVIESVEIRKWCVERAVEHMGPSQDAMINVADGAAPDLIKLSTAILAFVNAAATERADEAK